MNGTIAGLLAFAPTIAATLFALGADTFGVRKAGVGTSIAALTVAAAAGLYAGVTVPVADLFGVFRVGGPFSAVPGVIAGCAALALMGGWSSLSAREGGGTTAALVTFGAAAAGLMAAANDLTTLLLVVETSAIIGYALVSDGGTTRSDEAAMKYFVQGSVATGFFVLGMAVLVGIFAPTGRYAELAANAAGQGMGDPALLGAVLLLAALAFKAGLAPFHTWAPDAYETAPVPNAAFLAAGPKLGAVAALTLFVAVVDAGGSSSRIVAVILALSVISVLVGSLGALGQTSFRRMLAYAGVAQVGYALLAIAMLDATSAVFFVSTYALATTGTFLSAEAFSRARPRWDGTIAGLAGLGREAPAASAGLSVLLISLAGIPPLLGFWGKLQVFATAIYGSLSAFLTTAGAAPWLGWSLAIAVGVGLIGSVLSLGYYGSVLRSLYLADPAEVQDEAAESDAAAHKVEQGAAAMVVVLIAILVVVLGMAPTLWGYSFLLKPFLAR